MSLSKLEGITRQQIEAKQYELDIVNGREFKDCGEFRYNRTYVFDPLCKKKILLVKVHKYIQDHVIEKYYKEGLVNGYSQHCANAFFTLSEDCDVYDADLYDVSDPEKGMLIRYRNKIVSCHKVLENLRETDIRPTANRVAAGAVLNLNEQYALGRIVLALKNYYEGYVAKEQYVQYHNPDNEEISREEEKEEQKAVCEKSIVEKNYYRTNKRQNKRQKKQLVPKLQTVTNLLLSTWIGSLEGHQKDGSDQHCRKSKYTVDNAAEVNSIKPVIVLVDQLFRLFAPKAHKAQWEKIQVVSEFTLFDTAFTTITVNRKVRTSMHRDTTDLGPFSPILAAGSFVGGQLLLTQYGIALNIQPGAFALVNVHEVHCNLPMDEEEISNDSNQSMPRHSFVFYARKAVVDRCQADNQAALQQKNLDAIEIARARKEFEDRNAALAGFL